MTIEEKLVNYPLFKGISAPEVRQLMTCINFVQRNYKKSAYMLMEGESVKRVGVILKGTVMMEKEDLFGNIYFFRTLKQDEIFGDPFLAREPIDCTVNYRAATDCEIMYFNYQDLFTLCSKHCRCHKVMAENLAYLLSQKTRSLLAKIEILSKNSLRERILTFFALVSKHILLYGIEAQVVEDEALGLTQVVIPYNHTELAEYLCVNRSAVVRELHRMEDEGILTCEGKTYTINFEEMRNNL